jgi:hypothetical protein
MVKGNRCSQNKNDQVRAREKNDIGVNQTSPSR